MAFVAHSLALDQVQCCQPISHSVDTVFFETDTIIFELCIFKGHLPIQFLKDFVKLVWTYLSIG